MHCQMMRDLTTGCAYILYNCTMHCVLVNTLQCRAKGRKVYSLHSLVPIEHANKNPAGLLIEMAPVVVHKCLTQLSGIDKA